MIYVNTILCLLICLATGLDLVLFSNLEGGSNYRRSGVLTSALLALAYMSNIFAMHGHLYTDVAPTELIANAAVLLYQTRRTMLLILWHTGQVDKLPLGFVKTGERLAVRLKANG